MSEFKTNFMPPKYKRPLTEFKWPAPFVGYALCCGQKPFVNFDPAWPDAKWRVGSICCLKCGNQIGVIANGPNKDLAEPVSFLYESWNRNFPNGPYADLPEGFAWGATNFRNYCMGSTKEYHSYFDLLKITPEKWFRIDFNDNCKIKEFELPKLKNQHISCQLSYISCTDTSKWNNFIFSCTGVKWGEKIREFLGYAPKSDYIGY